MKQKKDAFDLIVDEAMREEDRKKKEWADTELVARMDQHAKLARKRMVKIAKEKNPHHDPMRDKSYFSKADILKHAECLPHEWAALTDAFDRMDDAGLGNRGRGWWLGAPEDRTSRRDHMIRVGKGVFIRVGTKIETDDAAGQLEAVSRRLPALRRVPGALEALGVPINAETAQKLLTPPGN